jgi:protein involved in polysaccharide export with SLBB domain
MRKLLLLAALSLTIHYSDRAVAQNTQPASADRIATARQLYQQGLALVEASQYSQAADSFRQAVQFDPEFANAYAALGRTYFKMRDWQKAVDNLNRTAALNSQQRAKVTIQIKPAQRSNAVAAHASNRYSLTRKNAEIVTNNEPAAATVNLRDLQPLVVLESPPPESSTPVVEETAVPAERNDETSLTKIYRVGANDVLDVRLNDSSEQQSTLFTVTAAGRLEHPLLTEPMPVAGLTVEEISAMIEEDLRKRAIVETPKALVGVRDYASHSILVSGLVKDWGTKFIRREAIPLYVVVADAQPLPEAATVTVVRSGEVHEIDLNQAADMNFLVRSGDVVTLRPNETQFVYIGGEVKSPGEKTFRRGLTLMQAILAAGGVGPKAKTAEIGRNNQEGYLVPTRYKLEEIVTGKVVDPVLKPGDRISIQR